jgi:general stress protein 26
MMLPFDPAAALAFQGVAVAATPMPEPPDHAAIRAQLTHARHAMLVTGGDGDPIRARPMLIATVEDDLTVWFLTAKSTSKARDIARDPRVHLTVQDDARYLFLSGVAEIVDDRARVNELWSPLLEPYLPNGPNDVDVCAIAFEPEDGELWDASGVQKLRFLWSKAKALLTGAPQGEPEIHREIHLR